MRREKEERREKSNGCTLSFYTSYLSSIFRQHSVKNIIKKNYNNKKKNKMTIIAFLFCDRKDEKSPPKSKSRVFKEQLVNSSLY